MVEVYRRAGCSEKDAHAFASEVALGKETDDVMIHLEKFDLSDEDMLVVLATALQRLEGRRAESETAIANTGTAVAAVAVAAAYFIT